MHFMSGCPVGRRASVRPLHWNLLFVYPELYHPCISLVLDVDTRLPKCFLDWKRNLEVPEASHHQWSLVWSAPLVCGSDTVAGTCWNCIELRRGECIGTEVLSEVWLSRRNTYKWDNWLSSCNNRNWFFFSVCLFRSSKGDVNSEGYVLEVECCSSLNHLSEKKEIPDFIKKVSKKKRGGKPQNTVCFYLHYNCCF